MDNGDIVLHPLANIWCISEVINNGEQFKILRNFDTLEEAEQYWREIVIPSCYECKSEIIRGAVFCIECGAKLQ